MEQEDFNIREHQLTSKERDFENALRPLNFEDFSGQDKVVDNLRIFVKAARLRGEALDHVLLHGPPGLGKTTLSNIIANELGVGFKISSGPVLDKPGDLAGVLTSLEPNDVLFIDEIHRLSPVVEEYLYSAMEDYRIDIMIDKGPSARSIQIDLNPFTLVGATTRSGLLTAPLRARFGINLHLEYYDDDVLSGIIRRSASILDVPCSTRAASEIASRSRGTPRIANALLRRVRDFAQVKGSGSIDTEIANYALEALNIDKYGLDEIDNKIENLWSVLFTTGYLTQHGRTENGKYRLTIPNKEIRNLFTRQIREWFRDVSQKDGEKLNVFCNAFVEKNPNKIEQIFSDYLWNTISIRDTAVSKERKENFYHGILLGLLGYKTTWLTKSNAESGTGYSDILVEVPDNRTGIVVELKYAEDGDMETACAKALTQIDEKNYIMKLKQDGMRNFIKYGIACYKKDCKVVLGE